MDNAPIVIRKYENRRLYDTRNSRYVNLDEVATLVRQGADVQVIDARTGEDLTRLTLTQIIVEDAKGREFPLPLEILRQLVVASGRAGQEGFSQYLRALADFYQNAYRTFSSPAGPLEFMRTMLSLAPGPWFFGAPKTPQVTDPRASASAAGDQAELAALRRRVEELERRLAESGPPPPPPEERA